MKRRRQRRKSGRKASIIYRGGAKQAKQMLSKAMTSVGDAQDLLQDLEAGLIDEGYEEIGASVATLLQHLNPFYRKYRQVRSALDRIE